jgi:putative colanic acid biosynthesis UDP-glucose lipid carrier transferase
VAFNFSSAPAAQPRLFRGQLSLYSLFGLLLDPVIAIGALVAITLLAGEDFTAPYLVLSLIVFSLTFPGNLDLASPAIDVIRDILLGWLIMVGILIFFGYATGYLTAFPEKVIVPWFAATPAVLIGAHMAARAALPRIMAAEVNQRTAVIVGANETGLKLAHTLADSPHLGTRLIGFFDDRSLQRLGPIENPVLGRMADLAAYAKTHRVDIIYVAMPMASQPRILNLLDSLRDTTASIYFVPDIFMADLIQARVGDVGGLPVVAVCETPFNGVSGLVKRVEDVVLSTLILALISPLMLAIAAGVKLTSPGPVLFKQRRYGLDGQEIVVYKFRSMTVCEDGANVPQARRNDQRITPFGAFLRRSSLDELPQFINVLQGRMSIVGPRPHAVSHNETYRKLIKGYMVRHKVKPGITGWAQVNGLRGETDTLEKMKARIEYDLDYLRNWSLRLDLLIILRTALLVIRDRNAY